MAQLTIDQAIQIAAEHHAAGRLTDAERLYRLVLEKRPDHPEALCLLAMLIGNLGRWDVALELTRRAVAANLGSADAHRSFGVALHELGRHVEAVIAFQRAIQLRTDDAYAYDSLGSAFLKLGRIDEAVAAHRKAVALEPEYGDGFTNLGIALHMKGQASETTEADFRDGAAAFREAVRLMPDSAAAWANLGSVHMKKGEQREAMAGYQKSVELDPKLATARSALIYAAHFNPDYDAAMLLAEARRYAELVEVPPVGKIAPFAIDPTAGRRLKVGYVSPDFRRHPVARFLLPLLEHHNRSAVEVICYSSVARPDDVTERIKKLSDQFVEVARLNDAQLAERIRGDQVDILVDLTLHMAGCRLGVFARRAAPVQVSWLGYAGTTGLRSMDYRLTDIYLDPPGEGDEYYSEKSVRLPHSYWCYEPYIEDIDVAPLPALSAGVVTFGSFNGFIKVTPPALECWARILSAVPGSRMVIHSPPDDHRAGVLEVFSRAGVVPGRIEFVANKPVREYLQGYNRIDIALDPFPYGGGTTTCDAAWMGVPTVTLRGRTAVGRGGVSILSNLGLTEWIAEDRERYVSIAAKMAGDITRLAEVRAGLRERMRESALMNGKLFAADVEAAFRAMWEKRISD